MTDIHTTIAALHRPKLLIRAGRAGIRNYRRDKIIRRISGTTNMYGKKLLTILVAEEARLNELRLEGDASYSIRGHIMVLTALLAEANGPLEPAIETKMAA